MASLDLDHPIDAEGVAEAESGIDVLYNSYDDEEDVGICDYLHCARL